MAALAHLASHSLGKTRPALEHTGLELLGQVQGGGPAAALQSAPHFLRDPHAHRTFCLAQACRAGAAGGGGRDE